MAGNAVTKLDLRGLKCPLPVLKARKVMQTLLAGELIELETTDPLAVIDIPAFCSENGHDLLKSAEFDWGHTFLLQKGGN
ncbi:MAG: sulfurtransferase TusA family protein [Rhizobiaceae bacterium]